MTTATAQLKRLALAALAAFAIVSLAPLPARADNEFQVTTETYPNEYTAILKGDKTPIRLESCIVYKSPSQRHFVIGYRFHNQKAVTATALQISADLYDPFNTYLDTLTTTYTGTYTQGAVINADPFLLGNKMPVVSSHNWWPTSQKAVCYVTKVAFEDGTIWVAKPGTHAPSNPEGLQKQ